MSAPRQALNATEGIDASGCSLILRRPHFPYLANGTAHPRQLLSTKSRPIDCIDDRSTFDPAMMCGRSSTDPVAE